MIGPRRKVELPHRRADQVFPRLVQLAELADFREVHVCVTHDIERFDIRISRTRISPYLYIPGGLHAPADRCAGLANPVAAELLVVHARHLDMDVDAVQQRTRDAFLVLGDGGWGAGAGLLTVAVIAARAGIPAITHFLHAK